MWTGAEVCAREVTPGHLRRVGESIGRRPFLWDNYPVNDGPLMSKYLHLRAFSGRPASIGPCLSAHGINLASQPVLSRVPALTLVESYRAGEAYDYGAAFERAARAVLGKELAAQLHQDLLLLEDRGLDRLEDRGPKLRERYAAYSHPGARENRRLAGRRLGRGRRARPDPVTAGPGRRRRVIARSIATKQSRAVVSPREKGRASTGSAHAG
jgi:hypothetical protein